MEAYRRHIVIDNINKKIFIQVMEDLKGYLKQKEYWDIRNKQWYKYVPKEMIQQFQKCIEGGYEVVPMKNFGGQSEEFYIIQVTEIGINSPVISG